MILQIQEDTKLVSFLIICFSIAWWICNQKISWQNKVHARIVSFFRQNHFPTRQLKQTKKSSSWWTKKILLLLFYLSSKIIGSQNIMIHHRKCNHSTFWPALVQSYWKLKTFVKNRIQSLLVNVCVLLATMGKNLKKTLSSIFAKNKPQVK